MLENKIYKRILISVFLLLVAIVLPWWILFLLFIGFGFFAKYIPYEYVLVGVFADYVYAVPINYFYNIQHVYTFGALLVVGVFLLRKLFTRA